MQDIPVNQISPWKFNPRSIIKEEEIVELSDSVKSVGIIQPIVVRLVNGNLDELVNQEAQFVIVAGEKRYRSAVMAELETIPAIVKDISRAEALEIAIIENNQRSDISAIEEAKSYRLYLDETGVTQTELANKIGRSQAHIANRLRLLKLPDDFQQKIISGEIPASSTRALCTIAGNEEAIAEIRESMSCGSTLEEAVREVKEELEDEEQERVEKAQMIAEAAEQIEGRTKELAELGITAVTDPTAKFTWEQKIHRQAVLESCTEARCAKLEVVIEPSRHYQTKQVMLSESWVCRNDACRKAAHDKASGIDSEKIEAEKKATAKLKREENRRRSDMCASFLAKVATTPELGHPEARFLAETLIFGAYNKEERLRDICAYMKWEISGSPEATIRTHITNDRPEIILKAAAICHLLKLEQAFKGYTEPVRWQHAGAEMNCYFNWLAGRGYNVPTKLGTNESFRAPEQEAPEQQDAAEKPGSIEQCTRADDTFPRSLTITDLRTGNSVGVDFITEEKTEQAAPKLCLYSGEPCKLEEIGCNTHPSCEIELPPHLRKCLDDECPYFMACTREFHPDECPRSQALNREHTNPKKTDIDHCRDFNKCEQSCEEKCGV